MTSASDREIIIELVNEAVAAGARQSLACKEVRITPRTLQRWTNPKLPVEDQRPHAKRPKPKHRLTDYERQKILQQLKYRPDYPAKGFPCLADAREWCKKFVHWYRHEHRHSGINFLTPSQHHYGLTEDILSRRKEVYAAARAKNPLRWKNKTRAWEIKPIVWLNRPKKISDEMRQLS